MKAVTKIDVPSSAVNLDAQEFAYRARGIRSLLRCTEVLCVPKAVNSLVTLAAWPRPTGEGPLERVVVAGGEVNEKAERLAHRPASDLGVALRIDLRGDARDGANALAAATIAAVLDAVAVVLRGRGNLGERLPASLVREGANFAFGHHRMAAKRFGAVTSVISVATLNVNVPTTAIPPSDWGRALSLRALAADGHRLSAETLAALLLDRAALYYGILVISGYSAGSRFRRLARIAASHETVLEARRGACRALLLAMVDGRFEVTSECRLPAAPFSAQLQQSAIAA